ncbi:sulfite exporter TauE/SafE family protein [Bizionia gelidisalsuginis]|uniref:Probable membrane transporter protein n=1 Tax=Bizionia gelidisalsuginis TaxID=291188 RepID=A0ABY3MEL5_9FLAO|nr:sulfite exporter TauE/SafE family protein [Bizionia gelidisalsuginis]TYC18051.1 sulfite exporter TauE/SafE family protein [Bizionia gelidisalsuginis]
MDFLHILGYFGALIIGLVMGLIGGGGSILSVPIFVYLFAFNPIIATSYSLFMVGVSSSFGAFKNYKKNNINFKMAFLFAIPAFIVIYLTRRYFLPEVPDQLFSIGTFNVTKGSAIMLLFAVVMLYSATVMLKRSTEIVVNNNSASYNIPKIVFQAAVIGFFTGLIGAGGGFVIVPALILLGNLTMKQAVGTSLFIISINSLIGFTGDFGHLNIDWLFLLSFTAIAVVGILIGTSLANKVEGAKLKKGFGWFVLVMAIFILVKELVF